MEGVLEGSQDVSCSLVWPDSRSCRKGSSFQLWFLGPLSVASDCLLCFFWHHAMWKVVPCIFFNLFSFLSFFFSFFSFFPPGIVSFIRVLIIHCFYYSRMTLWCDFRNTFMMGSLLASLILSHVNVIIFITHLHSNVRIPPFRFISFKKDIQPSMCFQKFAGLKTMRCTVHWILFCVDVLPLFDNNRFSLICNVLQCWSANSPENLHL